ncbi:DUF5615 family PIN-like protein [Haloferula sp. A504]|uniref:DUF5615 family PIN-like protein n=1 Tax=Haloferula sp. A504 TaxID=3373601 RepID=UPI0031C6948D|nr:DUF5615 family PIN-like protein [Verrucomicrobiaceae bacterium E54]
MTIILDENLPLRWREYLQVQSHEVLHWTEIGSPGDSDEVILEEALQRDALILTQDLDFTRLLALRGTRLPSVVQLRVACPIPEEVGAQVLEVLESHANQLATGCLVSLNAAAHRIRLLPLKRKGDFGD